MTPGVDYPDPATGLGKRGEAAHFRESNKQLYKAIQESLLNGDSFASELEKEFPGITKHVTPGPRGGFKDSAHPSTSWHHEPSKPGLMQLVPRPQHKYQKSGNGERIADILHPNCKGGMEIWGGGR